MSVALVALWPGLAALIGLAEWKPFAQGLGRRISGGLTAVALLLSMALLLRSGAAPMIIRWQGGLSLDALAGLLLPSVWVVTAGAIGWSLLSPGGRLFRAIAALLGGTATATMLVSDPLLAVLLLQVLAGLILACLLLDVGASGGGGAVLRIASILKLLTMGMLAGACLTMALLLTQFFSLNRDRLDLPNIIITLLIVGFGVTLGAVPFYFHLPDLFDTAPPFVTALLVGPVQTAVCVYLVRTLANNAWIVADRGATALVMWAAFAGSALAGVLALGQKRTMRMLAFTSMQEVGWIAGGLALGSVLGWQGALWFLAVRAVAKPVLAAVAGFLPDSGWKASLPARLAWMAGLLPAAWSLGALAVLGLPLGAGFWGMGSLVRAAVAVHPLLALVLLLSVFLGAISYGRVTLAMGRKGSGLPGFSRAGLATIASGAVALSLLPWLSLTLLRLCANLPFLG